MGKKSLKFILNTSNPGKLKEFESLFNRYGISLASENRDLPEIACKDPITVVIHKVSQLGVGYLVEDTSLEVEGAEMGTQIKWLEKNLPKFQGRKALWRVLLAYQKDKDQILVYEGLTRGTITAPQGKAGGFGFDPYFLPEGASKTLAEEKLDATNARAKAIAAFIEDKPIYAGPPIHDWKGDWQGD